MAVNLQKGQKISLEKEAGGVLTKVVMGLGWDAVKSKGFLGFGGSAQEIDLDASCIMFDEQGNLVDAIWFRQLKSKDGSIVHTGDNRTGDGDGDDEQIIVDLTKVPSSVMLEAPGRRRLGWCRRLDARVHGGLLRLSFGTCPKDQERDDPGDDATRGHSVTVKSTDASTTASADSTRACQAPMYSRRSTRYARER